MKKLILPILFLIFYSCGGQIKTEDKTLRDSIKINTVDTNQLIQIPKDSIADDEKTDDFFNSKEFKKIGNRTGIDMLFEDGDTLHIVGSFHDSFVPDTGKTITEFISKIFYIEDYNMFSKYKVIEHASDLAADDCRRYFFENKKLKEIKYCK